MARVQLARSRVPLVPLPSTVGHARGHVARDYRGEERKKLASAAFSDLNATVERRVEGNRWWIGTLARTPHLFGNDRKSEGVGSTRPSTLVNGRFH